MNPLIGMAMLLLPECPYFYEFFPDPVDVPDNEGEYIMIKWESAPVPWDSIYLQMDDNRAFAVHVPPDSFFTELLLHRAAPAACPVKTGLLCRLLTGTALPNSRATVWSLRAGNCRDTVYLPVPRAGEIIRRFESEKDSVSVTLDSLISYYGEIPLYISEFAPCPEEGIPEWFEITNRTVMAFPLNGISDCKAKSPLKTSDSIRGKSSVLITKDSTDLRAFLQTAEIPVYQVSIATLKNLADTLRLCSNSLKLDSVMWGKQVKRPVKCPGTESVTPGFVPRLSGNQTKILQISERVLERSKKNSMLRIRMNSESKLELRLIDRNGTGIFKKNFDAQFGNSWIEIPEWRRCQNGPCFIRLQGEGVDETAAFVVRP